MIYLDSAATSYHKPNGVARAVAEAISHMGNPGRGAHEASLDASRVVYGTREKMAELFGAEEASQICPTDKFTRADMDAFLLENTGLTLAQTNQVDLDAFDYLPEYDAYYHTHGDTN